MGPNPQETADLVIFTEEILNGKLHFLCICRNNIESESLLLSDATCSRNIDEKQRKKFFPVILRMESKV